MPYPTHLNLLVQHFKKLPGIGQKTAERFAFRVIDWPEKEVKAFSQALLGIETELHTCGICGALAEQNRCFYCDQPSRLNNQLCIVAYAKDIFAIEETHAYRGLYHVLGSLISPMQSSDDDSFNISELLKRIDEGSFEEIILALDSTIEGDATTLFIKQKLEGYNLNVSRLAFGIPVGSSLDYIDGSTLSRALSGRRGF